MFPSWAPLSKCADTMNYKGNHLCLRTCIPYLLLFILVTNPFPTMDRCALLPS